VADITSPDLPEQLQTCFDCVILSDIVEHVPRPDQLLRNMRSLVKDDGLLILTTVNGYQVSELSVRALRATRTYPVAREFVRRLVQLKLRKQDQSDVAANPYPGVDDPGHIQFFSLGQLNALFEDAGFSIAESHCRGSILSLGAFGPFRNQLLQRFDDWLGKLLPPSMTSAWYFGLRPVGPGGAW
jgi:SAM-dependent methyltransferase